MRFLSNNTWQPENASWPTISHSLFQPAIDDGSRTGPVNSFDDVLALSTNNASFASALHNVLLATNPIKPSACDSQTCTFFGCTCWYRTAVEYTSLQVPGPNTVVTTGVDGGWLVKTTIPSCQREATRIRSHWTDQFRRPGHCQLCDRDREYHP